MRIRIGLLALAIVLLASCQSDPVHDAIDAQLRQYPDIPDAACDLAAIDSLIARGELILHHSPAFEAAYHPHYRIVARAIAEQELF